MNQSDTVSHFKKGLEALQNGYPESAVVHLRSAFEHDSGNPFYASYYGVALARTESEWARAEGLCQTALRMRRDQAALYVNLAAVYRRTGKLEEALSALYNGLHFTQWDARLVRALNDLGIRRPPVLRFVGRDHFINRQLGKLRHRLVGRNRISVSETVRVSHN